MEVCLGGGFPEPRLLSAGLPGQAWGLQSWYSVASPTQGRPPLRGSGFVQVLFRKWKPSSQSREQDDQGPQAAQPPLPTCWAVPPARRRSSTRAGGGGAGLSNARFFQTVRSARAELPATPAPAPSPGAWKGGRRGRGGQARACTVRVAGSGAVRGAGSGLCPSPTKLQAVGVGQGRAASEAESLLLPRPAPSHVHRQPRGPRRVAPHFGAALRVARLEFLGDGSWRCFTALQPPGLPCGPPRPGRACTPGSRARPRPRARPGPHHCAARAGVAVLTGPTPGLYAAPTVAATLAPGAPGCPEDGYRARCVFVTEPEGYEGRGSSL